MKNLVSLLSCFSVVVLTLLLSCQDRNEIQVYSKLEQSDAIARNHGGDVFVSYVTISKGTDGSIIGAFTTAEAVKTFTLQREKSPLVKLPASGDYEILYLKHLLILNDTKTGERYLLTVGNDPANSIAQTLPSSYTKGNFILNGHGLSMSTRSFMSANSGEVGCATAGGAGSTSCTNACCSVSCSPGYYASCTTECTCKRNAGNQQ